MEARPHTSAAPRTRAPSTNASLSVLRSLQTENENLRFELLRSQQRTVALEAQLSSLRGSVDDAVEQAVAANAARMRALEERCRLLADRLVASKRDEQVSESARVGFLLRAQLEERRFLKREVQAMLDMLTGAGASATEHGTISEEAEEVHTGALYRLVMAASNALLEHAAAAKLDKARARLNLEHAATMLDELHGALRDATKAAFEAAAHASAVEELAATTAGPRGDGAPPLTMVSRGALFPNLRHGYSTPSPFRPSRLDTSATRTDTQNASSAVWSASPTAVQLSEELEWVCDVLKACVHGVREVGSDIAAANEELRAPPLSNAASRGAADGQRAPPSLVDVASPEMSELLRSFVCDLAAIKRKAAEQQEVMARQLAQEVDRHCHSTLQYEERIRLLERECTRLLRYAEHVAEEHEKSAATAAAAAVPTPQAAVAAPTPSRHDASVTASAAEVEVTPERYVAAAHPRASSLSTTAAASSPAVVAAATAAECSDPPPRLFSSSLGLREGNHRTERRGTPDDSRRGGRSREESTVDSPSAEVSQHHPSINASLRQGLDHSVARSLLSPRRERPGLESSLAGSSAPPVAAAALSQSAAAAALWASYRNRSAAAATSAVSSDRRLMSPAPPPPPPPPPLQARPVEAERASHRSPWRRSRTATATRSAESHGGTAPPLSSVSSSFDRLSPLRPSERRAEEEEEEGLVNSHTRYRSAAETASPTGGADGGGEEAAEHRGLPAAMSPLTPPRPASSSSQSGDYTRLSQQLYDEAAADLFSDDAASSQRGAATRPRTAAARSSRRLRDSRARPSLCGGGSPEVRQPLHLGLHTPLAVPRQDDASGTSSPQATPPAPAALPSVSLLESSGRPLPATPPMWRRIRDETSVHPTHLPSPIASASDLFGTPREVSWTDS